METLYKGHVRTLETVIYVEVGNTVLVGDRTCVLCIEVVYLRVSFIGGSMMSVICEWKEELNF